MRKIMLITAICLHVVFSSAAGPSQPSLQYEHVSGFIHTPVLELSAGHEIQKSESFAFQKLDFSSNSAQGSLLKGSWNAAYSADPLKAGIGLTIVGSILTVFGAALIIGGTQQHSYTNASGYHKRDPTLYYLVGAVAGAGGLAMLIPGVVLISRHRR
jgi:hypothetical protein